MLSSCVRNFSNSANVLDLRTSLKANKAALDQNVDKLLDQVITQIIKIIEPGNLSKIKADMNSPRIGSANQETVKKLTKTLFSQLSQDFIAPPSVFGPLAGLSGNHTSDELSKAIDRTMTLLE